MEFPERMNNDAEENNEQIQKNGHPKRPEMVLTNPGVIPPFPSKFAQLVENLESERIRFLLNGCPEVKIPSIVYNLNFDETEAVEALESLPVDIRYIVESVAKYRILIPYFR